VDRESLRLLLTQGQSLEEIGRRFNKSGSTVGYWIKKYGLEAAHIERHASRGGLERSELAALVAQGQSMRSMARELDVSLATVRHWMAKYDLQAKAYIRGSSGGDAGPEEVERRCSAHGLTTFGRYGPRRYYRCKRCRSAGVTARRRKVKQILAEEAGGRCALCGYHRSPAALHFHHLDPEAKTFELSRNGVTRSIARAREEAAKCLLLCANCHAEVEAGSANVEGLTRR
jgi:transposase